MGDAAQIIGHELHDEEDGNRNYNECMPACAQCDPSKRYREHCGDKTCQGYEVERRVPAGNVPVLAHERNSIGAHAEIGGVTKCNIACVTRKDVPACCCCREKYGKDR